MKFKIETIDKQIGAWLFSGLLEGGPLLVGDDVEFLSESGVLGTGLVCGVLVDGKALDRAEVGQAVQCPIRSKVVSLVKVGDLVQTPEGASGEWA